MTETDEFFLGDKRTLVSYAGELPVLAEAPDTLHVFDSNTAALFRRLPSGAVVLEPGEASKDWAGAERIISAALERGMARDSLFVAVGGGMICDLTAFAASVFMRGARVRLVPTSLLSMADASFGGKTAINFGGYKNLAGTFYPAEEITISAAFLRSLPRREFLSGLAEVIKYAMLGGEALYATLRNHKNEILSGAGESLLLALLRGALRIKAGFVMADPTEKGARAYLNLGHSFGHGLEAATGFNRFTHGEAVAWGTLRALDAGARLGITDAAYAEEAARLFADYGFPARVGGAAAGDIMRAMETDKKKKGGEIRFVLQRKLCENLTRTLDESFVRETLLRGLE